MKVEELKKTVDANAAEMRAGFASVDEHFASVDEHFARVDEHFARVDERFARVDERFARVDERFDRMEAALNKRIDDTAAETRRHLGVLIEEVLRRFELFTEDVDDRIDRKIAASELRLTRKFGKR